MGKVPKKPAFIPPPVPPYAAQETDPQFLKRMGVTFSRALSATITGVIGIGMVVLGSCRMIEDGKNSLKDTDAERIENTAMYIGKSVMRRRPTYNEKADALQMATDSIKLATYFSFIAVGGIFMAAAAVTVSAKKPKNPKPD